MSAATAIVRLRDLVDAWFTAPEPNAVGRMGLFRIVYALFYLWHLSLFELATMSGMPSSIRRQLVFFDPLSFDLPPVVFDALEKVLVAALVLLLIGWRVRWATVVVLIFGVLREAWPTSVDLENSNVFLVFYIPLLMTIVGRWDATYSLDALLARRRGEAVADAKSSAWQAFLGARAVLVVLAALFVSAALFKALGGGTWLVQEDLLANLMLERSVASAGQGLWANPLAPWIAATPSVYRGMQLGVLVFEACFFVVLFGRSARNLVLAIALVFHAMNALFMVVTFTPVLIVYAMFVDWEALWSRVRSRLPADLESIRVPEVSARMAVRLAWALALATALAWHGGLARWFNFFGLVDWQTPWLVILPLALASIGLQTRALLKPSPLVEVGQAS